MIYTVTVRTIAGGDYLAWTRNEILAREFVSQIINNRSTVIDGNITTGNFPEDEAPVYPDCGELKVYTSVTDPDCSIIATEDIYVRYLGRLLRAALQNKGGTVEMHIRGWTKISTSLGISVCKLYHDVYILVIGYVFGTAVADRWKHVDWVKLSTIESWTGRREL